MKIKRTFCVILLAAFLIGCFTCIGSVAVFSYEATSLTMIGASIRTSGVQGLRFVARISKSEAVIAGTNANFGILLIPQTMLGENEQITVETTGVSVVPAQNIMTETQEYYEFNAVLTGVPAEFYGSEIIARAYLNDNGTYTYSDQISRSVKAVAAMILADQQATNTDIVVANQVMELYRLVGNDILIDATDIWNAVFNIPQIIEDFSLMPNEYYVKVENGQTLIGVFNKKISNAETEAKKLLRKRCTELGKLEEGFFEKASFELPSISYSTLSSIDPKLCVYGGTDKDPLTYTGGDKITFRLSCFSGEKLVNVPYIQYEIYNDTTGKRTTGFADASSGTATITVDATGKAGVVYIDASVCDSSRNKITNNVTTIDNYHFRGAAIIDLKNISMSVAPPDDFDSFWADQKSTLYDENIEILKMVEKSGAKSGFKLFYVELKCNVYSGETDGIVSGYLTYPTSASVSSKIDLRVAFKGYSFSASEPSYNDHTATFSICAHSIDCERANSDSNYLKQQESKNTIFNNMSNSNRDTAYFRGMILRDLQAARFMVEYFGEKGIGDGKGKQMWNGETFIASGASQGAFQAIAVAALDKNITELNISIPWMCDVKAANGRRKSDFIMGYTAALEYYDTTSFAHLITCKTIVSASLGDSICPASGVVSFYNALACEKTLSYSQNASHSAWLQSGSYKIYE